MELALAAAYPFDGFITADKNLLYQKNLCGLSLRIVVLGVVSTRSDYLLFLLIQLSDLLSSLPAGSVMRINDRSEMMPFNADQPKP